MPKGLVTKFQGKQQLCIDLYTYDSQSLVGKCEGKTGLKGLFWCHITYAKGAVLLMFTSELGLRRTIIVNVHIFVPINFIQVFGRAKAPAEPQE